MRVLIAGAGGVIGLALTERLVADGHTVIGLTRSPDRGRAIRGAGGETILCDVLLERQAADAVAKAEPDAIIHELSNLPPDLDPKHLSAQLAPTNRLRREGTRNLIGAARALGVQRLLAQSIAFAYAPAGDWVKSESEPLALDAPPPQDEVVSAVCDLERQVLDASGIVLRYGNLYGANTYFGAQGAYARLAAKRQLPIVGAAEGRWSFIHTRDAADATALALERRRARASTTSSTTSRRPLMSGFPCSPRRSAPRRPHKVPAAIGVASARLLRLRRDDPSARGQQRQGARRAAVAAAGIAAGARALPPRSRPRTATRWRFAR